MASPANDTRHIAHNSLTTIHLIGWGWNSGQLNPWSWPNQDIQEGDTFLDNPSAAKQCGGRRPGYSKPNGWREQAPIKKRRKHCSRGRQSQASWLRGPDLQQHRLPLVQWLGYIAWREDPGPLAGWTQLRIPGLLPRQSTQWRGDHNQSSPESQAPWLGLGALDTKCEHLSGGGPHGAYPKRPQVQWLWWSRKEGILSG